jgi:hypothetical protein
MAELRTYVVQQETLGPLGLVKGELVYVSKYNF